MLQWAALLLIDLRKAFDAAAKDAGVATPSGEFVHQFYETVAPGLDGEFDGPAAYSRSKRAEVVLAERWAEELAGTGVVVNAMHPGWAATPGIKHSIPTFERIMRPLLRTPEQGADTIVWLAAAEEAGAVTGRFWSDRHERATHHPLARTRETPEERERLWHALDALAAGASPRI